MHATAAGLSTHSKGCAWLNIGVQVGRLFENNHFHGVVSRPKSLHYKVVCLSIVCLALLPFGLLLSVCVPHKMAAL